MSNGNDDLPTKPSNHNVVSLDKTSDSCADIPEYKSQSILVTDDHMHCNLRETLEELLQYRQGGNVSLVVREDCVPSSTHDVLVLAKTNQKSNGRSGKVPSSGNRKNDLDSLLNEIARTRCSNSGNRTRRDGSDEGKRQNPRKLEQLIASTDAQNGKEMLASLVRHHFDEVEDDGDADSDSHRLSVFARFCSWLQNGFCPRERTFPLHSQ